jgi:Asp-tRNA(Asn)/Glu-tRNA(Gln) amidotransferase A subunit family amidase
MSKAVSDPESLMDWSAAHLAAEVRARRVTPREAVLAALHRIEDRNPTFNAFVCVCAEAALRSADELERRIAAGEDPGLLAGVPVGVKDLEDVAGLPTTFGSFPFRDNVAKVDSVQVARLRAAGAIVVGKTNTPEFGSTAFTHNRLFGTTCNPWNPERTAGGSSGGSAAAIAARMVPIATGSDGGGSVRIPASYVGAFGFKPTKGRIPVGEAEALGMQHWIDTVCYGPITRSVEDAALMLDAVAGYHPADPDSLPAPRTQYRTSLDAPLARLRMLFSRDLGYARVQSDVMRVVESAVDELRALGHEVEESPLRLPDLGRAWAYQSGAENWAEIVELVAGREHELGRGFWRGLEAASELSWRTYAEFQRERAELNHGLAEMFAGFDVLLTPTMPTDAFVARGPLPDSIDGTALESPMHAVAFTYPFNLSGHPAATVRAGFSDAGLPVGLQIVAERHRDDLVLQVAHAFERARPMVEWPG